MPVSCTYHENTLSCRATHFPLQIGVLRGLETFSQLVGLSADGDGSTAVVRVDSVGSPLNRLDKALPVRTWRQWCVFAPAMWA